MRNRFRNSIVTALVGALTLTSMNLTPAQAASTNTKQATSAIATDFSARRYHHGNSAAALAMFGLVAGSIAAAAAADRYDDGCCYGGPYYGGYGYGRGYGFHHGWHGGGARIGRTGGHGGGAHRAAR